MYCSLGIVVVGFQLHVYCYVNLCRQPTTSVVQSSTYASNIATLVIDGDKRTTEKYCAHTEVNRTKAWLQIGLGQPYNIRRVKIFYRKEDSFDFWKPFRFRQFYLDVSNTSATQTSTANRTRCYTDNTTYPDVPPNIIDIPCQQTARYVIVETTYDAPEDGVTSGAILEICEVEVYGKNSDETNSASTDTTKATSTAITTIGGDGVYSGIPTLGTTTTTKHDRRESVATILLLQTYTTFPHTTAAGSPAEANTTSGTPEEATSSNDTTEKAIATSGTTEEASVATIVGDHHHNRHEEDQEASTPVEEGLGSTGKISSSSHPSSTGSSTTPPDVSPSCTSLILVKQAQISNNIESILYAVLPVLCTSLIVNICTIIWLLRNNACKKRDVIKDELKRDTEFIPTTGIYDTADDNYVYQELDQLSGPSHYSQF